MGISGFNQVDRLCLFLWGFIWQCTRYRRVRYLDWRWVILRDAVYVRVALET